MSLRIRAEKLTKARYDHDTACVARAILDLTRHCSYDDDADMTTSDAMAARRYGSFDFLEIVLADALDDVSLDEVRVHRDDVERVPSEGFKVQVFMHEDDAIFHDPTFGIVALDGSEDLVARMRESHAELEDAKVIRLRDPNDGA